MKAFFLILAVLMLLPLSALARTLKPGDVLEITVTNNPSLSRKVTVNEDGTIDYPLYSDRSVTSLTAQELMDQLTVAAAKADPANMVVVNLLSEYKMKISVLGAVKKPGMILVDKGASLQEVLLLTDGINEMADLSSIKLIRKGRTEDDAQIVNLEKFLQEGTLSGLPDVQNGDTYIVLKAKASRNVKVLGAVRQPGFYNVYPNANLFDLIQMAGGQLENADLTKVRHITTIDGKRVDTVVNLREFWDELGATDRIPKVREGDMIILYKKTVTWSVVMDYIRDGVTLLTVYLLVTNSFVK